MTNRIILMVANLIMFNFGLFALATRHHPVPEPSARYVEPIVEEDVPPKTINYSLTNPTPDFLNNQETIDQLKQWQEEAPELVQVNTYGKTSKGRDIYYIKITGPKSGNKKVVLITACIHGNEPWSASTVMNYIGVILDKYGDDEEITELVNTRELYFVPIVSPDSYGQTRFVDGVDPNRDFPTNQNPHKASVPPVRALQELFLQIRPNAVISGHTFGRIFLTPWGDQNEMCPNEADFSRIVGKMAGMCQYRIARACQLYGRPIYGTEVDWYYKHGAFAVVMEFGTHQRIPSKADIDQEFNRTFKGVLYFIKEAPEVQIQQWAWAWLRAA